MFSILPHTAIPIDRREIPLYFQTTISLLFVLFLLCMHTDDKDQKKSQKVLAELENIDDECDGNDIAFVKIDDDKEAGEWGIDEVPTIVKLIHF